MIFLCRVKQACKVSGRCEIRKFAFACGCCFEELKKMNKKRMKYILKKQRNRENEIGF